MSLDTSSFDKNINDLTNQLNTAQSSLDADNFGIQLAAYNAKQASVKLLQEKLSDANSFKQQAIDAQTAIDSKTQEIADLVTQSQGVVSAVVVSQG